MGYESKLIVVDRKKYGDRVSGEVIAEFKISGSPLSFNHKDVFQQPIDFDLYRDGNIRTREDCYGEHCCMAKPDAVAMELRELQKEDPTYRRYQPAIALLEGFDLSQWEDLEVIHWGY